MSLDPQTVCTTIFRETLSSFAAIQALVEMEGAAGQYKIFWENVPDFIKLPYITMAHIAGGDEQSTQVSAIDAFWKIVGHTGDPATAAQLINAIHTMHRQDPVIISYAEGNPDDNEVWRPYNTIRLWTPVFDRDVVQNVPYFIVGGIYRIRLIRQEE